MNDGFINADLARNNYNNNKILLDEINKIENSILDASNNGLREVLVLETTITNTTLNSEQEIESVDTTLNQITITTHGLETNDLIVLRTTDELPSDLKENTVYRVNVVDVNIFELIENKDEFDNILDLINEGSGDNFIRKLTEAQNYYYSWKQFVTFKNSRQYVYILENIENYFRKLGYTIKRYKYPEKNVLYWKIFW